MALVDRTYELGLDEFAWRLDWCRIAGVSPILRGLRFSWVSVDNYMMRSPLPETVLRALAETRGYCWSPRLQRCYSFLLRIPREVFPDAHDRGAVGRPHDPVGGHRAAGVAATAGGGSAAGPVPHDS